jgi:hypothetical protein
MRLLGWALIQYIWCPYLKNGKPWTQTCQQGRLSEDTQREHQVGMRVDFGEYYKARNVKDCQQARKYRMNSPREPSEGTNSASTLTTSLSSYKT